MANQRGALRKDDRLDVLSNMVSYWLEAMALDSLKAVEDEKRKQSHEFARLLMATQVGGGNATLTAPSTYHARGAGRPIANRTPTVRATRRALKARRTGRWR